MTMQLPGYPSRRRPSRLKAREGIAVLRREAKQQREATGAAMEAVLGILSQSPEGRVSVQDVLTSADQPGRRVVEALTVLGSEGRLEFDSRSATVHLLGK